jgi:RNA polymerase sigma-70 factor (ECF subfamily)
MESVTDAELMAEVRRGDREAFAGLINRHKDTLVNYLNRLTGCRDRAEDFAQEAFLRLYQSAPRYHEQGRLVPYLYRIATNLVRSEERKVRRWRFLSSAFSYNGHQPGLAGRAGLAERGPQSQLIEKEIKEQVNEALAALPAHYRAPLVLREIEGWSYQDIAKAVGCREGTVKSRINRGRSRLKEILQPYLNGGRL